MATIDDQIRKPYAIRTRWKTPGERRKGKIVVYTSDGVQFATRNDRDDDSFEPFSFLVVFKIVPVSKDAWCVRKGIVGVNEPYWMLCSAHTDEHKAIVSHRNKVPEMDKPELWVTEGSWVVEVQDSEGQGPSGPGTPVEVPQPDDPFEGLTSSATVADMRSDAAIFGAESRAA